MLRRQGEIGLRDRIRVHARGFGRPEPRVGLRLIDQSVKNDMRHMHALRSEFPGRDRILPARRRHLAEGVARTVDWIRTNSRFVDWVRPDAGAICCVRLKPSAFDDAAVSRFQDFVSNAGVRVADGPWFGDEVRVFRLGFGSLAIPDLEAALDALSGALRRAAGAAA